MSTRISGAFLVLLIPCLILLRRIGRPTLRQSGRMVVYGVVAVAGAQFCYFSAVQYLSVGVALLLEYLAPVLLIGWHWARSRNRPAARSSSAPASRWPGWPWCWICAAACSSTRSASLWGLGAAVCLAAYFILAEENDRPSVHPLLLTTAGTGVGRAGHRGCRSDRRLAADGARGAHHTGRLSVQLVAAGAAADPGQRGASPI